MHATRARPSPSARPIVREGTLQARLFAVVAMDPGIGMAEARARAACGWGAMYRALAQLLHHGIVVQARVGRRTLLYPRGGAPAELSHSQATIKGRTTARMVRVLAATGGATASDLRLATGAPERTVYYHLTKLQQAGLVRQGLDARSHVFVPTPVLVQLAAALGRDDG